MQEFIPVTEIHGEYINLNRLFSFSGSGFRVFGVIGAAMILGEQMEIREYIGSAIVFVAVLLAQADPKILLKKRSKDNE